MICGFICVIWDFTDVTKSAGPLVQIFDVAACFVPTIFWVETHLCAVSVHCLVLRRSQILDLLLTSPVNCDFVYHIMPFVVTMARRTHQSG